MIATTPARKPGRPRKALRAVVPDQHRTIIAHLDAYDRATSDQERRTIRRQLRELGYIWEE